MKDNPLGNIFALWDSLNSPKGKLLQALFLAVSAIFFGVVIADIIMRHQ